MDSKIARATLAVFRKQRERMVANRSGDTLAADDLWPSVDNFRC